MCSVITASSQCHHCVSAMRLNTSAQIKRTFWQQLAFHHALLGWSERQNGKMDKKSLKGRAHMLLFTRRCVNNACVHQIVQCQIRMHDRVPKKVFSINYIIQLSNKKYTCRSTIMYTYYKKLARLPSNFTDKHSSSPLNVNSKRGHTCRKRANNQIKLWCLDRRLAISNGNRRETLNPTTISVFSNNIRHQHGHLSKSKSQNTRPGDER